MRRSGNLGTNFSLIPGKRRSTNAGGTSRVKNSWVFKVWRRVLRFGARRDWFVSIDHEAWMSMSQVGLKPSEEHGLVPPRAAPRRHGIGTDLRLGINNPRQKWCFVWPASVAATRCFRKLASARIRTFCLVRLSGVLVPAWRRRREVDEKSKFEHHVGGGLMKGS